MAGPKTLFQKLDEISGCSARLGKTSPSIPGRGEALEVLDQDSGGYRRDGDGPDRRSYLRFLSQPPSVLQPDQLLGDSHLSGSRVEPSPAQPDQLAPAHARIHGQIDQRRPVAVRVGLGERHGLVPRQGTPCPAWGREGTGPGRRGLAVSFSFSTATCSIRRSTR